MRRLFGGLLLFIWLVPDTMMASMLYIEPPLAELRPGSSVVLEVRVDVDRDVDECINLVDAVLTIPDTVQVVDTSTGRSIFRLWVEEPVYNQSDNTVTFAGGIPNGYCGRLPGDPEVTNILAELVVRTRDDTFVDGMATPSVRVDFASPTTMYLNDGFGTYFSPDTYGTELLLNAAPGDAVTDVWIDRVRADTTPPEPFSIYLERDDVTHGGQYYIVFNTTDKQTGIAGYEVMEEPLVEQGLFRFGAVGAPWVSAKSPYRLRDQTLNSTIRVKAIDKAGNEYIATLVPDPSLRVQTRHWVEWLIMVTAGIFVGLLLVVIVLRRRQRVRSEIHTYE